MEAFGEDFVGRPEARRFLDPIEEGQRMFEGPAA
jgi:hypothetical protein